MNTMLQSPPSQPPGGIMPQQGQQNPLARLIQLLSGGGQTQGPQPQGPMFHIGPSARERQFNDKRLAQAMSQRPTGPWGLAGGLAQVLAGKMRQNALDKREEKAREGKYNALRDAMSTYTSGIQSLPEDMHGPPEQVGKGFSPQAYAAAAVQTPGLDMGQFQRQAKIMVEMHQAQQKSAREKAQNERQAAFLGKNLFGPDYTGKVNQGGITVEDIPTPREDLPQQLRPLANIIAENPSFLNNPKIRERVWRTLDKKPQERRIIKAADGYNYDVITGERVLPNVVKREKSRFSQAQLSENERIDAAWAYVSNLPRQQVQERLQRVDKFGVPNPNYNPQLESIVRLAMKRKHGDDPEHQKRLSSVIGMKEQGQKKLTPSEAADNFLMGK